MSLSNSPAIGDIVLDPSEKFKDENQEDKYDLLLCDGSEIDEGTHPVLWGVTKGGLPSYTGTSFSFLGQDNSIAGFDNSVDSFWAVGNQNSSIYQYDLSGVYSGNNFSIGLITATSLCFDGDNLLVYDNSTGLVTPFTTAGVALPTWDTGNLQFEGVTYDGTYLWFVNNTDHNVYQYTKSGIFTGTVINTSASSNINNLKGITWDESNQVFWLVNNNFPFALVEFTGVWGETGNFINVATEEDNPQGATSVAGELWMWGLSQDRAFQYIGTKTRPDMTSPDPACPYRIVADLT